MATPRGNAYAVASGGGVFAGRPAPTVAPFEIIADGAWTWCDTIVNAVERNGALYVQVVDSAGTNWIYKRVIVTGVTTSFQLGPTALEADDHNAGSLMFDALGRIVSVFGRHNDDWYRFRRSTAPEDISSYSAVSLRGATQGPYSYPHLTRLSQMPNRAWLLSRRWEDGTGVTRRLTMRTADTMDALSDAEYPNVNPWSAPPTDLWRVAGYIPYWQLADDGVRTLHVAAIDRHPVQGQNSLYHWYMRLDDDNSMRWYRSDGTEITGATLPFGPANVTEVYDGSTVRCWAYDLALDAAGRPRILYCRYPGNGNPVAPVEYWQARWTGAEWAHSFVVIDDHGLYVPEVYYAGGLSYDRSDASRIALSAPISGVRQIQEWAFTEATESWSQVRVLTSGGTRGSPLKFRPIYVRDRQVGPRWLWLEGRYTTYTDYATKVMASN